MERHRQIGKDVARAVLDLRQSQIPPITSTSLQEQRIASEKIDKGYYELMGLMDSRPAVIALIVYGAYELQKDKLKQQETKSERAFRDLRNLDDMIIQEEDML